MTTDKMTAMLNALTAYTKNPTEENRTKFIAANEEYITARAEEIMQGM